MLLARDEELNSELMLRRNNEDTSYVVKQTISNEFSEHVLIV